ncbi:MAG: response regulator [Desulfoferrobacter sp.]
MKKILVVEDNADNRDLVCALLEDHYILGSCSNANEALDYLQSKKNSQPDLLLLDISLPGIDGIELLQRIRCAPELNHIPAIALTAHAMKNDGDRFIGQGFDGYVSKPIVDDTLLFNAIARLIS